MIFVSEVFDGSMNRIRRFESEKAIELHVAVKGGNSQSAEEIVRWYWTSVGRNSSGKEILGYREHSYGDGR